MLLLMKNDVRQLEAGRNCQPETSHVIDECDMWGGTGEGENACTELDAEDDDSFCIFCRCFGRGCRCP